MPLFKFSFILFLLSFSLTSNSIEDNKCLSAQFDVDVIHKGQPFGLLPVVLKIKKNGCIISIYHEKMKFMKNNWTIDVCREPVHIKKGAGAVEVLKKVTPCKGKGKGPFCSDMEHIFQKIQDDGLIFAEGQKESLESPHGKTYCAYLLAKKYLDDSLVFNRGDNYAGVLQGSGTMAKEEEVEIKQTGETTPSVPRPIIDGMAPAPVEEESPRAPEVEAQPPKKEEAGVGSF